MAYLYLKICQWGRHNIFLSVPFAARFDGYVFSYWNLFDFCGKRRSHNNTWQTLHYSKKYCLPSNYVHISYPCHYSFSIFRSVPYPHLFDFIYSFNSSYKGLIFMYYYRFSWSDRLDCRLRPYCRCYCTNIAFLCHWDSGGKCGLI